MKRKKILRTKEREIAKAGRLVFDALFGEDGELEKKLQEELPDDERDSTARGNWEVVDVEGHSLLRCDACGRELILAGSVDVALAERHGWRFAGGKWTCSTCTKKT